MTRITHRKLNEGDVYRAWRESETAREGAGARVYLIDTGVWRFHDEFSHTTIATGINSSEHPDRSFLLPADSFPAVPIVPAQTGPVPVAADPSPANYPCNNDALAAGRPYHGTATASLVVGKNVGVAPGAELISVKARGCSSSGTVIDSTAVLIGAFNDIMAHYATFPKRSVISISAYVTVEDIRTWDPIQNRFELVDSRKFECGNRDDCVRQPELTVLEHTINDVINSGIPVVASANNHDADACQTSPARVPNVITVGGIDRYDRRWDNYDESAGSPAPGSNGSEPGSNYGPCVDIWAPATEMSIAVPWKDYSDRYGKPTERYGTSFAAPIVAGVIARMMAEDDALTTSAAVWERLRANATLLDTDLGAGSPKLLVYHAGVTFKSHPADAFVDATGKATLSVEMAADAPNKYFYQWLGAPDAPAGTSAKTYAATPGTYKVRVTRCETGAVCGDKSTEFWAESRDIRVMAACQLPTITQPSDRELVGGGVTTLSATISGTGTYRWEWHKLYPPGAPVVTGQTTTSDRTAVITTGGREIEMYQLLVCPPGAPCNPNGCTLSSEVVRVSTCLDVPTPQITVGPNDGAGVFKAEIAVTDPPAGVRLQWLHRPPASTSWTPVRLNLGNTWTTERGSSMRPYKRGSYAAFAGNACDVAVSAPITLDSACQHSFDVIVNGSNKDSGVLRTAEFEIAAGRETVIYLAPRLVTLSTTPPQLDVRYQWPGQTDFGTAASRAIAGITQTTDIVVKTKNVSEASDCEQTITIRLKAIPCTFTATQSVAVGNGLPQPASSEPYIVPSGSTVKLKVTPSEARTYTYSWFDADTMESLHSASPEVAAGPINGVRRISVNIQAQPASLDCVKRFDFVITSEPVDACDYNQPPFQLAKGFCSAEPATTAYLNPQPLRSFSLFPTILDSTGAPVTGAALTDWLFTWERDNNDDNFVQVAKGSGEYGVYRHVTGTTPQTVRVRVKSPQGKCATFTYEIVPTGPACTEHCDRAVTCKRRTIRTASGGTNVHAFTPGESVTLSVDAEPGETFEWHRLASGVNSVIGVTPAITVVMTEAAEYWVVITRNGESFDSDRLQAIPITTASSDLSISPAYLELQPGDDFTLTATFARPAANIRYEWRRGATYDATARVIGTEATLRINDISDHSSFWCRVIETIGGGSELFHNSNIASIMVPCPNNVHGAIVAHPSFVAAGQSSYLAAAVYGKLVDLSWYRVSLDGTVRQMSGGKLGALNFYPTEAVTRIGAIGTSTACGQTGTLNEATVYRCVPTIVEQPQNIVIKGGESATLTAFASPALSGQVITTNWYAGQDQYSIQSLGEGWSFTTPVIPPGTSRTFKATFRAACTSGGTEYKLNSAIATVEACAPPVIDGLSAQQWSTNPGSSAGISVYASGAELTYQWYEGETGITSKLLAGKTDQHESFNPTISTRYWCRITSRGLCTTDTESSLIRVCSTPQITAQPQNKRIFKNATATLSVTVDFGQNTETRSYQWQEFDGVNWKNITGANADTYTTLPLTDDASYRVIVKAGLCSIESEPATVDICVYNENVPAHQPSSYVRWQHSTTLYLPYMSPVEYKDITWYRGVSGDHSQPMRSAVATNLANDTGPIEGKQYFWAEFTHLGCVSKTATYTVEACVPEVTTQPVGATIPSGTSRTLSIATTPIPNQTYQWYAGAAGVTTNPVPNGTGPSVLVTPQSDTTYWCRVTTPCGRTVDSDPATITTCTPAEISWITPDQSVPTGTSVTLRVNASGLNRTAQWYLGLSGDDSQPLTNQTSEVLTITAQATKSYWCRITTSGVCKKDSPASKVTICTMPSVTGPTSRSIFPGSSTTLSVTVSSPAPVTYQWYRGTSVDTSTLLTGETTASLSVTPSETTSYWVKVKNGGCEVNSTIATVSLCVLPPQVNAPADKNIFSGESVTLSLPGMSPVVDKNVTWYKGIVGQASQVVKTGINVTYTTPILTATTKYWAEFTHNGCTSRTTQYTVNVCKPKITSQPQGIMVDKDASATLAVTATGSPLAYQWYKGARGDVSVPANNGTSSTLSTGPMTADTSYWVRVTGCGVSEDSNAAIVSVCLPPEITSLTKSGPWGRGQIGQVAVTATGPSLSYQWYKGQSGDTSRPITNATSATHSFTTSTSEYYWVRVRTACTNGTIHTRNSAAILYSVVPVIDQPPADVAIPSGGKTRLTVTASGTYLSYQWYSYSGAIANPIPGETRADFVTPALTTQTKFLVRVYSGEAYDSKSATVSICGGPTISKFEKTAYGPDDFSLKVTVPSTQALDVKYHWYSGTPGLPHESVDLGENNPSRMFWNVTTPQTIWVRVWWEDDTCYKDSAGISLP